MNIRNKIVGTISMGLFLLTTLSGAYAFPTSGSISISGDRGGYVVVYALRMLKLKESGKPVQFRGRCDSACTLFLALPARQVCVTPKTSFNFHMPYGASASGNRFAASYMLRSYPGWVRNWIRSKGGLSNKMLSMNYAYASKFLPSCKGAYQLADNSASRVRQLEK
ncbi:MAG: hypothetical protein ABI705_00255 [Aestuariivirga sp.]